MTMKFVLMFLLLARIALAANAKDEATVREAYAKLSYATQARIVATAGEDSTLTRAELTKLLQLDELRFEITDMSSGNISDIDFRPFAEFVTQANQEGEKVLMIPHETHSVTEFGKLLAVSLVATPRWTTDQRPPNDNRTILVKQALMLLDAAKYSRYVTATITVRFQGQSRTYHALWLFSDSDLIDFDPVTNGVGIFAKESAFPSILTDTHLRTHAVVNDWLTSTQRFDASCKAGKVDVCCDSAMRCGVLAEDLRNTKAPLNPLTEGKIQ